MAACIKQRFPEGSIAQRLDAILCSFPNKIVHQLSFLRNNLIFFCRVNKGLKKTGIIIFMFVFLQLSGLVSGQLLHAFNLQLISD